MPSARNFTVLCVEDEENDLILLRHAWREVSIEQHLEVARDGKEALSYFQRQAMTDKRVVACGLVLLDLNLPRLSGFEVLLWLRRHEHFKRLPVLIFTSSNQEHDIQLAYEMGANAYIMKPASLDTLVQLLRSVKDFWLVQNTFPHLEN
jgi:CheY-like chemotaxis protein